MPVISPQGLQGKTCYTCLNGPTADLNEYLVLTFNNNTGLPYEIPVYVNSVYKITYYDSSIQDYRTITGTVTGVSSETIAVSVTVVTDKAGNICLCNNRDNLSGFVSTTMYYVPITNISSILLIDPTKPDPSNERSEEFVAILGISSTIVRAVIVRLKIFNDDVQKTITPVDLYVGGEYHVVYTKNNSIFEIDGRLIAIEEVPLFGNESPECGYVRQDNQVVGANGNIYDPRYFYNLPKYNPDGDRIKLVFDTSKDFMQLRDTVMLKDIRNVIPLNNGGGCQPPIDPGFSYPPPPPYPGYPCYPYPYNPFKEGPSDTPGAVPPGDMPNDLSGTGVPSWVYQGTTTSSDVSGQTNGQIVYEKLN